MKSKVDWIAKTFLIRREWMDGEDERIHEEFCFDRKPQHFFATISQHADVLVFQEVSASPAAYFLRWGIGKDWERKGQGRVFVVVAVPLARFSNERIIFKYIGDLQPYPWIGHMRTYVQLRAWARLLSINKNFYFCGEEIPYEVGKRIESNTIFLRDVIEHHCTRTRDDWHPEDYAVYPEESLVCKDAENFPAVIDFLREHKLPWEKTQLLSGKRGPHGATGK